MFNWRHGREGATPISPRAQGIAREGSVLVRARMLHMNQDIRQPLYTRPILFGCPGWTTLHRTSHPGPGCVPRSCVFLLLHSMFVCHCWKAHAEDQGSHQGSHPGSDQGGKQGSHQGSQSGHTRGHNQRVSTGSDIYRVSPFWHHCAMFGANVMFNPMCVHTKASAGSVSDILNVFVCRVADGSK